MGKKIGKRSITKKTHYERQVRFSEGIKKTWTRFQGPDRNAKARERVLALLSKKDEESTKRAAGRA